MVRLFALIAVGATTAVAGCGVIIGVDGDYTEVKDAGGARDVSTVGPDATSPGEGGGSDGGPRDSAPSDSPTGEGGGDGGQVLFTDGFETTGCPGWSNKVATRTFDTTSRTGSGACRVCAVASDAGETPGIDRKIANPSAGRYRFDAYARQPPGQNTPSQWSIEIEFKPFSGSDFNAKQQVSLSQTWTFGSVTLTSAQAGQEIVAKIRADLLPGECILVDDAVFVKEN